VLKPVTIHSEFGVVSTPVIDPDTGTIYVVRWGYESGISGPTYRLFGLDMSDLSHDKFGSVLIDGYNIGGMGFDRYRQIQRAGLALATKPGGEKALVIAFGGGEGQGTPSGWVIAFDVFKLAHGVAPANVWSSVPNNDSGSGGGGSVWMANAAPAVDDNGDIYVATGNGPNHPQFAMDQLGESVVKLSWNPGDPGSLTVADWFTPFLDRERDGAHRDQDLASAGVIALPDETGLIAGGKDGVYYHLKRSAMGHRDFTKLLDSPFVASCDYTPLQRAHVLFRRSQPDLLDRPVYHRARGERPHSSYPGYRRLFQQPFVCSGREQPGARVLQEWRTLRRQSRGSRLRYRVDWNLVPGRNARGHFVAV
jgi:hypothetical protein